MEEKKIKTTVPYNIFAIVEKDIENFGITKNGFYNRIFKSLKTRLKEYELKIGKKVKQNIEIRLNINKENQVDFYNFMNKSGAKTDSEFMRNIIATYSTFPPYEREKIVFSEKCDLIEEAAAAREKIYIKYRGETRKVEPYFIAHSIEESHNYLYCWCESKNLYLNYRLSNIEEASRCSEKQEKFDEEYIKNLKLNFDPFLSYGKTVKAKMGREGREFYEKVHYNRPKIVSSNGEIYCFECSIPKAKAYFPQFMGKIEILEPQELREWFAKELERTLDIYKKGS